ncbi:MAG: aminoglycoside phosphotransferase family protein [Candidatus Latescibacterota bacterium]
MLNKFGKAFKSKVKTRLRRDQTPPVDGLPQGIDFDTLAGICSSQFGESLLGTSFVHLSSWKQHGEYRLYLETKSGRLLQLIYKEAILDDHYIPALSRLHFVPGPSECAIYRSGSSGLMQYLPRVYLCDELIHNKHYRYVFEDLEPDYREPASKDDFYLLARQLRQIHISMREWLEYGGEDELIRYEGISLDSLQEFIKASVMSYTAANDSEYARQVQLSWKRMARLLNRKDLFDFIPMRPIHGDFNITNIHIHKENREDIKLVDWEWAGIGIPHADLASLLKSAPPHVEEEALEIFIQHIKGWTMDEQKRLYWLCKLERGLLDAAFLSVQQSGTTNQTRINYSKHIENALQSALRAFEHIG